MTGQYSRFNLTSYRQVGDNKRTGYLEGDFNGKLPLTCS